MTISASDLALSSASGGDDQRPHPIWNMYGCAGFAHTSGINPVIFSVPLTSPAERDQALRDLGGVEAWQKAWRKLLHEQKNATAA